MIDIYKIIGALGLVLICTGMAVKKRQHRNIFAFFGGIGLLIYSIYIKDIIFTVLEIVYIIIVSIDFIRHRKNPNDTSIRK